MIANLFGPDLGYVVVIILVVLVGGSQLPKIARNIGVAGKEFRKAQSEAEEARPLGQGHEDQTQRTATSATPNPTPPAITSTAPAAADNSIRVSPAELDALLRVREEQVRRETSG